MGTPAYMSPEQARLVDAPVGTRTDVWSLGAILFELLTGARLLADRGEAALALLARGAPDLGPLSTAPTELAAIARRALAWRPEDRYPSAEELARDLGHYLDDRLVEAHPYSALDHLRRFVRRRRVPLVIAAAGLVALVLALARGQRLEDVQRAHLLGELAAGRAEAAERVRASRLALDALALADTPKARGVLAATLAGAAPHRAEAIALPAGCDPLGLSPDGSALACRDASGALTIFDFPGLAARWSHPIGTYAGAALTDRWVMVGPVPSVDGRPYPVDVLDLADGRSLADANFETRGYPRSFGRAVLYRGAPRTLVARGDPPALTLNDWCGGTIPTALAASPSGERLIFACSDPAMSVRVGRADGTPAPLSLGIEGKDWATALAIDDAGALLVGSRTGRVWRAGADGARQGPAFTLGDGPVGALVPVGDQAVVITDNARWLWHPDAGAPERLPPTERALLGVSGGAVWTTDGAHAHRWEPGPPRAARLVAGDGLASLAVADTGEVITGEGTGCFVVYDASGRVLERVCDPGQVVKSVGYLPGARLAIGERIGRRRFVTYDLARQRRGADRVIPTSPRRVAVMADDTVYAIGFGSTVHRIAGDAVTTLAPLRGVGVDLAASPDRRWAAALDTTGTVFALRGGDVRPLFVAPDAGVVGADVDGALLVGGDDHLERRAVNGTVLARARFVGALDDVAVDLRGRVASGHRDGTVRVWSRELTLLSEHRGHRERAALVAFAPDDELWSAGWDAVIRRWDLSALDASPEALSDRLEARWGPTPPR